MEFVGEENRIIKPGNGLGRRDHKAHPIPSPGTPSTRTGCSELHQTWSWTRPGMGQPHIIALSLFPFFFFPPGIFVQLFCQFLAHLFVLAQGEEQLLDLSLFSARKLFSPIFGCGRQSATQVFSMTPCSVSREIYVKFLYSLSSFIVLEI